MKNKYACIMAGIFLVTMIAAAVTNYIYVKNTAKNVFAALDSLPEDLQICSKELQFIFEFWEDRRKFLDLTLSKPELETVSGLFEEAIIAADHGNDSDYKTAMARLRRAIADINDLERISAEIIF